MKIEFEIPDCVIRYVVPVLTLVFALLMSYYLTLGQMLQVFGVLFWLQSLPQLIRYATGRVKMNGKPVQHPSERWMAW